MRNAAAINRTENWKQTKIAGWFCLAAKAQHFS